MNRRNFVDRTFAAGISAFIPVQALNFLAGSNKGFQFNDKMMDNSDIIPAPDDPGLWNDWRAGLQSWRKGKLSQLKYDGSSYLSAPFRWVSSDFSCCFIMICDSDFYDVNNNTYSISSLIERGKKEYGGYDSVVLWQAYPRIGLDERNQFDFYREVPDGLAGLKVIVKQFHESDIRVFIDYNPWDTGTRRELESDINNLIDIIQAIDADGIFLDTMKDAPDFRRKLDEVKKGIVLEGEIALPLEYISSHHMSWAQWFRDSNVPGVYRNKWFERHHMQHAIDRWNSDKTPQLHAAWMNGSGILIWENVFGQWLGWNERDKSVYRAMYSIQHHFKELFSGENWIPLSEESPVKGVYVSSWYNNDLTLRTLVNRNDIPVEGQLVKIKKDPDSRYFDLISGQELFPESMDAQHVLKGRIISRGIGCFLAAKKSAVDNNLLTFIANQRKIAGLASESIVVPVKEVISSNPIPCPATSIKPAGMVPVPSASLNMSIEYRFREPGGFGNIQEHLVLAEKNQLHSLCVINKEVKINSFAIDETPVTNALFREFLLMSGYKPAITRNFLKHWINEQIPLGKEDHPVVYVDINDAMAYAAWAGKRLPTTEEWQYAAQGPDALNYPWGNNMEPGKCNPGLIGETSSVRAFPEGKSPFGCLDMCGNTWELTAPEYTDGRTRFLMLKGGSCYRAEGSVWYFDGGPQNNRFIAKMLLIWPGLDRCSTVGFRCAADLIS
jgi:formylglycine-generating enzyme required for sulfatase activity